MIELVTISLKSSDYQKQLIDEFSKNDFTLSKGSGTGEYYSFKYKNSQFFRFCLKDVQHIFHKPKIRYFQNSVKTGMNIVSNNLVIDFDELKNTYDARIEKHKENITNKSISNFKQTLWLALLNEHLSEYFGEIRNVGYRYSFSRVKYFDTIKVSVNIKEMSKKQFGDVDFESIIFHTSLDIPGIGHWNIKNNIDSLSEFLKNINLFESNIKYVKASYSKSVSTIQKQISELEASIKPKLDQLKHRISELRKEEKDEIENINILEILNVKP